MNLFRLLSLLVCLSLLCGCQSPKSPSDSLSPEELVKKYQFYIDHNTFEEAGKISTPEEGQRLAELADFISRVDDEAPTMESTFLKTDCRQVADTAWCSCLIMDEEGQEFSSEFRLLKVKGQWLMDVPEDESVITEDEMEVIDEIMEGFPEEKE